MSKQPKAGISVVLGEHIDDSRQRTALVSNHGSENPRRRDTQRRSLSSLPLKDQVDVVKQLIASHPSKMR